MLASRLLRTSSHCFLRPRLVLLALQIFRSTASFSSYYSGNMNFITERDGAGTITMTPKNEAEQSALLVICHGLGDTADGFDDVAEVS